LIYVALFFLGLFLLRTGIEAFALPHWLANDIQVVICAIVSYFAHRYISFR
jgi:putative flippase GtrA